MSEQTRGPASMEDNPIVLDIGAPQPAVRFKGEQRSKSVSIVAGRACNQKGHCHRPPRVPEVVSGLESGAAQPRATVWRI